MVAIADLDTYNSGMQKSMQDKLWFMDLIGGEVTTVYDYGCADGTLLKLVRSMRDGINIIGYDNNFEMLRRAAQSGIPCSPFQMNYALPNQLTVASSVFHEIHAYGVKEDVSDDYSHIFGIGSEYIAIRDMFYSENMPVVANGLDTAKVYRNADRERLAEFEKLYGPISLNKNMLHWFLKYRYISNWERELHENYLFESFEEFLRNIPDQYECVYSCLYTLPYLKERALCDYGIDLQYPTHGKILLKKIK